MQKSTLFIFENSFYGSPCIVVQGCQQNQASSTELKYLNECGRLCGEKTNTAFLFSACYTGSCFYALEIRARKRAAAMMPYHLLSVSQVSGGSANPPETLLPLRFLILYLLSQKANPSSLL